MTNKQTGNKQVLNEILNEVSRIVIGKDNAKEILLLALLCQGHVLIEGRTGTAKTTLARSFSQVLGGDFKRIQGTPDMLPADMLGFYHFHPDGSSHFMPGPIFANVVLVDELNRLTPRSQSALLEAMQERQVTIERQSHPLKQHFMVIAAQLPYGSIGTAPISNVQLDRFMFRIWSGQLTREEENRVLENIDQITESKLPEITTPEVIADLQQEVKQIHIADSVRNYIIDIVDNLRRQPDLSIVPSARGSIALFKGSRALAYTQGRDFVIPDDVKELAIPALSHRLRVSTEAEMGETTNEDIIIKALSEVAVPRV